MTTRTNSLLLKLSAAIGLLAGVGVFAAGVIYARPGASATQPELTETQRAMQSANRALQAQNWPEAVKGFERVLELDPDNEIATFRLAYSVHVSGAYERAIPLHQAAAKFRRQRPVALYNLGCAYAMLGRADEAFEALSASVEAGFTGGGSPLGLASAYNDPDLASIRDDPRFDRIFGDSGGDDADLLHFWVGDWDCYSVSSKRKAGTNTLSLRNGGSVILEHWEAGDGTSGESWNWYSPDAGVWKQVWVSSSGSVTEFTGRRQGKGIIFEGVSSDNPDALQRMHVRPIGKGRVRQTGEATTDGGENWAPLYDLIYVPRGQDFDGEI